MTLVASLLFTAALAVSIAAIYLTLHNAMPRIIEIVDTEFGHAMQTERRIFFGEVKGRRSAEIVAFPRAFVVEADYRLAA